MIRTTKPQYRHDCERCTFIGSIISFGRSIDLYRSCSSIDGGYIARFSDEGSDYATVSEGWGPFIRSLDGDEWFIRSDFLTCVAVEKVTKGEQP